VIQALETAHQAGRGTIMLNGRLVEQHHVAASKRIIALAQMIKELEAA
jgi:citrate lyase subunit beta/citryl-CoA lyase